MTDTLSELRPAEIELLSMIAERDPTLSALVEPMLRPMPESVYEERLDAIESHMRSHEGDPEFEPMRAFKWTHCGTVSVKTMVVEAGTLVSGKRHKTRHINIVTAGSILLFTPDGPVIAKAGQEFVSESGVRKLGLAMENCAFANVFENPKILRDEDELESEYAEAEMEALR